MLLKILLLGMVLSGMSGCAQKLRDANQKRYVWPPSAEHAKIEYLGFYSSEANFKQSIYGSVSEVVFGVEPARPIFASPFAVDAWQGKVLVTDTSRRRLFVMDLHARKITPFLPQDENPDDQAAQEPGGRKSFPVGVAIIDEQTFLITDINGLQVKRYYFDGRFRQAYGEGQLVRPTAVAVDRQRQRIAVVDTSAHRVALYSFDGDFLGYLGERGVNPGQFNFPVDADFDAEGDLLVLDSMNFRVQRFSWQGNSYVPVSQFGELGTAVGSFARPKGLAISSSGHIYISDALAHNVKIFDRDGTFLMTFGGLSIAQKGEFAPGGFYLLAGIACDDQDGIWVVDSLNRMIHHFQYLNEQYLRFNPILPEQLPPVNFETQ